ncbi:MAG: chromosome segregation protein SMC, partial [Eubacteriales bacterium]
MRLKSLEIHGFKSFPDRTKIRFSEGMTVIVGPNGSGKSNISDAIRWVLGELSTKSIRGNKMEDVIFGGTNGRSPMSFAEVSLTIENSGENRIDSDFDEITITRRYYRSGDSEYLINNKPSRLRDITEMFMNTGIGKTGYSIVGQGRVSEIISQKSEERRIIFEEAAGISKYRYKKQDAERRLAETDENLVRITDIVNELSGRIGPLEKDAAKARIYLDLYEKKKALDISLAVYDIEKINAGMQMVEHDYLVAKQELELADDALASYDTRLETLSGLQLENRTAHEQASAKSDELTKSLHTLESGLMVAKNDLSHYEQQFQTLTASLEMRRKDKDRQTSELENAHRRFEEVSGQQTKLEEDYEALSASLEDARTHYQTAEQALERLEAQKAEILRQHTEARISLSALDESKHTMEARKAELSENLSALDKRIAQTKQNIDTSQKTLDEYAAKQKVLSDQRDRLVSKNEERMRSLAEMENRYQSLLANISSKEQRALTLKRMEEHFEGYSRSVKFVADAAQAGRITGICGPVSQLISVDRKYSIAIETALGANLQNIVVENEAAAKAAIALLKRENQGRSTFYPITSMRPANLNLPATVRSGKGYVGIAADLISFDRKYYPVLSSLLGRTLVFDNLDNAAIVAKAGGYTYRIVTLDGQIINAGGSFTGGSVKRDSGILTRSVEIEEILAAKAEDEKAAADLKRKIEASASVSDGDREEMDRIGEEYLLISALCKAEQTGLSMQNNRLAEQVEEREGILLSIKGLEAKESEKANQRARLTDNCKIYDETASAIQAEMQRALEEKNTADRELNRLISEKNDAIVSISVQKKEVEVQKNRCESLSAELNSIREQIGQYESQLEQNRTAIKRLSAQIASDEGTLAELTKEIGDTKGQEQELTEKSLEIEKEINDLRQKSKSETHQRERIFTRYTSLSSKMESASAEKTKLTDKIWEEYELSYADARNTAFEPVTEE